MISSFATIRWQSAVAACVLLCGLVSVAKATDSTTVPGNEASSAITAEQGNSSASGQAAVADASNKPATDPMAIRPFEIVYDVGNNVLRAGNAYLSLKQDGELWTYTLRTKPSGVFKLTGRGRIHEVSSFAVDNADNGLKLRTHHYVFRQDKESKRSVDAWFNWEAGEFRYLFRGEETQRETSDDLADRLSVTLVVRDSLDDNFELIELPVFDSGRVKIMHFINEGRETIDTRLGSLDTIRIRSRNRDSDRRQTLTWFAPSLGYLPVRIEQHKGGELVARMSAVSINQ